VINYAKNFLNEIIVHFRVSVKHDGTDGIDWTRRVEIG